MSAGARLRRLLALWHVAEDSGDRAGGWRLLGLEELIALLRAYPEVPADPELTAVVQALARDREEIPAALKVALTQLFQVSDTFFDDPAVADQEEARLVPRLLGELGVAGAQLCRCPPSLDVRLTIWTELLGVARQHALTDRQDGHS